MSITQLLVVVSATALGAMVQGSIGIGLALVAGPLLVAIDPAFAPGPLLVAGQLIGIRHVVAEREHTDRAALRRSLYGLPVGVGLALVVLATIDEATTAVLIGALTAMAALALLIGLRPRRSPTTDMAGGGIIAFCAVAAGLPGPPAAMTFHDMTPNALRGTTASFVLIVASVGVVGLAATGGLGWPEVLLLVWMIPGIVVGLAAARRARRLLDRSWFRPAVLVVALVGGLALAGSHLV